MPLQGSPRPLIAACASTALLLLAACAGDRPAADTANGLPLGAGGSAGSGADVNRLPLTVRAALDSGNTAMRAKDYDAAIAQYRAAAAGAPKHAAPWFGLHMAARAASNDALADSAMRQVQQLTNDPTVLPSHEEVAAAAMPPHSGGALPAGHPTGAGPAPAAAPGAPPAGHPPTGTRPPSPR